MFVLCFTRFEQYLGDTVDSEGWVIFYVCIVSDVWATQLTPRDGLNSMFVLCFTYFERHLGDTIDSEGLANFYV